MCIPLPLYQSQNTGAKDHWAWIRHLACSLPDFRIPGGAGRPLEWALFPSEVTDTSPLSRRLPLSAQGRKATCWIHLRANSIICGVLGIINISWDIPVLIKAHISDCWRPLHGPCSTKCPRARSDTTRSIFRFHASWRSAYDLNLLSFAFQCFVFHLESWCLWRVGMCGRCTDTDISAFGVLQNASVNYKPRFLVPWPVPVCWYFLPFSVNFPFHFWRFPSPCTQ